MNCPYWIVLLKTNLIWLIRWNSSLKVWKTLREKDKMLFISFFSFPKNVWKVFPSGSLKKSIRIIIPLQNKCFWAYTGTSLSVRLCTKYYFLSKWWWRYQVTFSNSSSLVQNKDLLHFRHLPMPVAFQLEMASWYTNLMVPILFQHTLIYCCWVPEELIGSNVEWISSLRIPVVGFTFFALFFCPPCATLVHQLVQQLREGRLLKTIWGKIENAGNKHFLHFLKLVLSIPNIGFWDTLILSSTNVNFAIR